jgi:NAD(P)-dependent dehydrogenase (short-subunit alcohol dehydrogenase family)
MKLGGSRVVVTGGSQGLGAALVEELARRGAHVVAVARREEALSQVTDAVRGAGGDAHALVADVADKKATYAIAGAAAALVGPIDIVIHNASTLGATPLRLLLDTECEDLARVLETNLVGPFRLTKATVGSMVLRGSGLVIHVSSDAATSAYPRWGAYGVSKAATDHLSRVWAAELDGTGVRFLSVDPGEMDTSMHADAIPDADRGTLASPRDVAQKLVRLIERSSDVPNGGRVELSKEPS